MQIQEQAIFFTRNIFTYESVKEKIGTEDWQERATDRMEWKQTVKRLEVTGLHGL